MLTRSIEIVLFVTFTSHISHARISYNAGPSYHYYEKCAMTTAGWFCLSDNLLPRNEARQHCAGQSGRLAIIDTPEKAQKVKEIIERRDRESTQHEYSYMIGFEKNAVWDDGRQFQEIPNTIISWCKGENYHPYGSFVDLMFKDGGYCLRGNSGGYKSFFVCEHL